MPGMFDNQPQKTTQSTTNNPYAPARPALNSILAKAQSISDPSSGVFTPSFSQDTTGGIAALGQLGQTPSAAAAAASPIATAAGGNYAAGSSALGQIAGGQTNPYINDYLKKANQLTADSVNQQFSAAGRYGSGAQTTALADRIGTQNLGALTGQFNTDQSNRLAAGQALTGSGVSGAQLGTQVDQGNASQIGNQIQAGQLTDQNAAATRLAPATAASFEAGLVNPIAAAGGTSNSTGTSVQQSNPLTSALGGAIGLGSLFSGGSSSAISGLMALSDERAKENIRDVGKTHDGQKIYSYNYKGDPKPTLGLLAQEVEKKHPEAVGRMGGMKTVNYRAATKGAAKGRVKNPSALGLLAG